MSRVHDFADMTAGSYVSDQFSRTGLDDFHHRYDTLPPPDLAQGRQSGQGGEDQTTIWTYYTQRSEQSIKDLVDASNNTIDVLLILAGLFSTVATAFISQTYPMLQPDQRDILISIYMQTRSPGATTALDKPFVAPYYAMRVNCFLFASLFISMLVALLGILVKQWNRSYQQELAGVTSPHLRARIRHFRFKGAERWHLADVVGFLSLFMYLALVIAAVGIIDLLLATAPPVGYVILSVFLLGVSLFLITTVLPLFVLDAPFRSPVSKLLSGIKNIRNMGRRNPERGIDDTIEEQWLEDRIEQSRNRESDETSIVRNKIGLDLEIICHLLRTVDKYTERWLLDLCFEKLPNLKLLEQNEPTVFHSHGIILEVYNFLAQGCIMTNKRGEEEVNLDCLPRARQLCRFLAWYLALPCTSEERGRLNHNLDKGGDPTILARLLAQDEHVPSVIVATTALGHIEHFKYSQNSHECSVCWDETKAMAKANPNAEPSESRDEKKVQAITSLLIKRSDCLRARTEPMEKISKECSASLEALQAALQTCNPTEKDRKLWMQVLAEKENGTFISLKDAWFTPLRTTLNGLQIKRVSSPFLPGITTAYPGTTNGTLQPPRLHINSRPPRDLAFQHRLSASSEQKFNGSVTTSPTPSFLRPTPSPLSSPNHLSP